MNLLKNGLANEAGINQLDSQVTALVKSNADLVTNSNLHWGFAVSPNAPVGVCLDTIRPVPLGYNSCNGHNVRNTLPDDTDIKQDI